MPNGHSVRRNRHHLRDAPTSADKTMDKTPANDQSASVTTLCTTPEQQQNMQPPEKKAQKTSEPPQTHNTDIPKQGLQDLASVGNHTRSGRQVKKPARLDM